jgi:CO/xanthine dehydrogenase FAD-binding subunit
VRVEVHVPRTLEEALHLRAHHPGARAIAGGTDLMVALNADRERPAALIDLGRVPELRGWRYEGDELVLGATLTYSEAETGEVASALPALAAAARTVGSPQIRNRGTIGGNLGTASPAGDALPPLFIEGARVELASADATRSLPLDEFLTGPKRNALADDELLVAVRVRPSRAPQTFMKIGPRNAMVISICSLALSADRERGELRAAFGSSSPVVRLVTAPLDEAETFAERVVAAASPIDDVRGTAAYRRHALGVLTRRALARCLV